MTLTPEQEQVVRARGRRIRIRAYAGTGKTSTLEAWAHAHPAVRTLYLVFNRSVREEAQGRFPRWVKVSTGHGLAYGRWGNVYASKLVTSISPWELARTPVLSRVPAGTEAVWADVVLRTVQRFLASDAATIDASHSVLTPGDWAGPFAWGDPDRLVTDAQRVWTRMQDPADHTVGMLHDGYLKQFVLSHPHLPYDAILLDEAQDANPVLLHLIRQQTQAQQIYVGDPFQAIYGWRGAVDAMSALHPDADLQLTTSFRFGSHIAAWATRILRWHDPALPPVRGLAPTTGRVYRGVGGPPVTFLARSNARLFAEAVAWLDRDPSIALAWVGGIDGYHLDWLADTARFYLGETPTVPFLRLFPDFDALQDYADAVEDVEWQGRVRAVERWGRRLPGLIHRVQTASRTPERASVWLSTIHKAKGLQWPHVVVLDDLAELTDDLSAEDHHLWYVAMTRATAVLGLPEDAVQALQTHGS